MAWWETLVGRSTRGRVVALLRRGQRSVEEMAAALGLTDNAVRAQLAALERDGVVVAVGVRRDGNVGKPATLYGVAPGTSALFSAAYSPTLAALLAELSARLPRKEVDAILRATGKRLAPTLPARATFDDRARAGAALLETLGADADLVQTAEGYELRGYACPLADAVATCPGTCAAVESLLGEVTGTDVRERCDRADVPRCRFYLPTPA